MNALIASAGLSSPSGAAGGSRPSSGGDRELGSHVLARRVLIIEDEAMIAWTLETMLEDFGFKQIEVAAAGQEAIEKAKRSAPGLIISDINLGEGRMDGVTASTSIAAAADVPVVFISGYASAEHRQRIARDLPDAALLRKPMTSAELLGAIQAATRREPH